MIGTQVNENTKRIRDRIQRKAANCGRNPLSVKLVAVSKKKPSPLIREAISAGLDVFGENYIKEAIEKIQELKEESISWHFIGHLQSNKAKQAVLHFDLIHSVDSLRLARELDIQAGKISKIQNILVQVNISKEATKSGIQTEDTIDLIRNMAKLDHISVRGLMTMPPFFDDPERARPFFKDLKKLSDRIVQENIPGIHMDELSMGMTGDFEAAIEEGATLVRIGTAIFGERL
ncbi:MAG: YggS family pyridoxal phosphate-dependent enzyme [Proteobacteria bacterium]|nr:YggS family pyridoxal phosphate-dependent enzyme [Pseudomonadota bacterium]